MSVKSAGHPAQESLVAFGLGRLDADEAAYVEQHLAECRQCCDTLLNLQDDTFTSLVRSSKRSFEANDARDGQLPTVAGPAAPDEKGPGTEDRTESDGGGAPSAETATMVLPAGAPSFIGELPAELVNHPRYEMIDLVGQGGMGNVYRARHKLMNRQVAIKVISPELVRRREAVERFRREVQAAAQLVHPNIVTAYDAEQAGDVHFLVMEFVDGTDLASVVRRNGPLAVADACDYIRQAAAGLQHAHEKGMVHRDIKPQNLMLSPGGQVRILDFGLANFITEAAMMEPGREASSPPGAAPFHLTMLGSVMGTPDYIAPEQARDAHSADIRSDVYSLGCTLYFLLTARPPFDEGSIMDRVKAHAANEAAPIQNLRVDIPDELAEVIRRMMAKDPAERPQSPAEVADALAPFVDAHRGGGGSEDGHVYAPRDASVSRPALVGVYAVGALSTVAFALSFGIFDALLSDLPAWLSLWLSIGAKFSLPVGVAILLLADRSEGTNSHTAAMGAGYLSLLPLNPFSVVLTPVTIWTLSVLRRPEVRRAYETGAYPVVDAHEARRRWPMILAMVFSIVIILAGIIYLATDKGTLVIESADPAVEIRISKVTGQPRPDVMELTLVDTLTGSEVTRLPSGQYRISLASNDNELRLSQDYVTLSRGGKVVVRVTAKEPDDPRTIKSFSLADRPITSSGVSVDEGAWRITADDTRTVRLFETSVPPLPPGPFFYRAKLKSEKVEGRAYLEMWVRFPGKGEFFSKGFHNAISGTNGWAEYEIPFFLEEGQQPDLVKLNLTIEGSGTVWIKDVELTSPTSDGGNAGSATTVRSPETPVASAEISHQLRRFIAAIRGEHSDEQLAKLLADEAPYLAEFPSGFRRSLAGLLAGLPEEAVDSLLREGYLKWPFKSLDESRQAAMEDMLRSMLTSAKSLGFDPDLPGKVLPLLEDADAGFAVLDLNDAPRQIVLWYAQIRNSPVPFIIPVLGVSEEMIDGVFTNSVYRQILSLEEKPYTPLPPASQARNDDELIQGVWVAESGQKNGQPTPLNEIGMQRALFKGDRLQVDMPGGLSAEGQFQLIESSDPKQIWVQVAGRSDGMRGIYKLEGDRLTLCMNQDRAGEVPTEFAAPAGTTIDLIVMRREKDPQSETRVRSPAFNPRDLVAAGQLAGHSDSVDALAFTSGGRTLLSAGGDGRLYEWNMETSNLIRRFRCSSDNGILDITTLPNSQLAVISHFSGEVALWDLAEQKKVRQYPGHTAQVRSLALTADGSKLLSGSFDGTVHLTDVQTGEIVRSFDDGYCAAVAIASTSPTAAHGFDDRVRIWNLETGETICLAERSGDAINALALSPDGRILVSGDMSGLVQVWNVATGREQFRVQLNVDEAEQKEGVRPAVFSASFLPDGNRFAVGAWDKSVHIIDAHTGSEIAIARCPGYGASTIAVSPDGKALASAGGVVTLHDDRTNRRDGDYSIRLWTLPDLERSR